ncbi:elongation factor P [Qipengyuania sp. 6D47A]|uniref:Elongation factor P n=2 Tax=Qipengyuania qiaonensis TaxID=2867240 RepID=A0ABS7J618_9SPHN|nr:elongation factor P [Qipengyuania qiaonensis]
MKRLAELALAAALAGLLSAPGAAQGRLSLLDQGEYICALPGDATGSAWIEQSGRDFAITGGSSYRAARGGGTYLMEGKKVTFTRGPMRGMKFMRLGSGMLQEIARDGKLGRLRCHRAGPTRD